MDVSPKTLREVEFREKLRGYHPEDVDQFLERVAAGIEALQEKLRQTTERAVHAEELASATGESDEALRRTLVLAQRTADAAIEEANASAGSLVTSAEQQARDIVEAANRQAAQIAVDAQRQLRDDLAVLEAARARLLEDVSQLEQWIEEHRASLSSALRDALQRVDEGVFVGSAPVEPAPVDVPPPATIDAPVAGDVVEADAVEEPEPVEATEGDVVEAAADSESETDS